MNTTRYVYAAGPITGNTFDEAVDWRARLATELWVRTARAWELLSPMRGKEAFRMKGPLPSTFDESKPAVQRDLYDIRRSDAVLVNLVGADRVSVGTMCELGYAHAKDKFIVVARSHSDRIHDHVFVQELASQVVPTLADAINVLAAL